MDRRVRHDPRFGHYAIRVAASLLVLFMAGSGRTRLAVAGGQLTLRIVDAETGEPLAARIHILNSRRRQARVRGTGIVRYPSWSILDGEATLKLRSDQYTFEVFAGPEYRHQFGHFEIVDHAEDDKTVELRRHADLPREGWWAGDLDMRMGRDAAQLVARCEDLRVAPLLIDALVRGKRKTYQPAGAEEASLLDGRIVAARGHLEWETGGGRIRFLAPPSAAESPPMHVDVAYPFSWSLPAWLASGGVDSFQLLGSNSRADQVVDHERYGRPRNRVLFPPPHGNTRWAETIYYHILSAGLRIPPSAGSGAAAVKVPAGTNRIYAKAGDPLTIERWFRAIQGGQVFITNGPLLRVDVDGQSPGHVFHLDRREHREFSIQLRLATRQPVEYLQIVKNGEVDQEVRLVKGAAAARPLQVDFDASGWFLVRAITSNESVYQFASTGPFYVEKNYEPRIARASVQFFLDWIDEGRKQTDLPPEVWNAAETFWRQQLIKATH